MARASACPSSDDCGRQSVSRGAEADLLARIREDWILPGNAKDLWTGFGQEPAAAEIIVGGANRGHADSTTAVEREIKSHIANRAGD